MLLLLLVVVPWKNKTWRGDTNWPESPSLGKTCRLIRITGAWIINASRDNSTVTLIGSVMSGDFNSMTLWNSISETAARNSVSVMPPDRGE